ncbi:MAG: toll/interleukin-1 receptor domain-containing protein [Myxococcota bacterium]
MSPEEKGKRLKQYVRSEQLVDDLDSSEADLAGAYLIKANLFGAWLTEANLQGAQLDWSNLNGADLTRANLQGANLTGADLRDACLKEANLRKANLQAAQLDGANLEEADLTGAQLRSASLINLQVIPPSIVDAEDLTGASPNWQTVARMLTLRDPDHLLCRTGMPSVAATYLVDALRSIDAADLFTMLQSVFLSFGTPDQAFAERLRADLTENGVKTWFYPEDAEPGRRHHRHIHNKIWEYDRLVLCCSRDSILRSGVLHEVEEVLQREQQEGSSNRLIPIFFDEDLFETGASPPEWWHPERRHIYRQLQGRVCARFTTEPNSPQWNQALRKLLKVLHKPPHVEGSTGSESDLV